MSQLIVKRTDSSSYFPPGFEDMERIAVEQLPGVRYFGSTEAVPETGDICLITNTHTRLGQFSSMRDRVTSILHPNSGYDNLLQDLWPEKPIILGNPIRAKAVAEWILAAVFQHQTFLRHHPTWPIDRSWPRELISERKTLLIGRGHIGKLLHTQLISLGVPVTVHDPWLNLTANLKQHWSTVILATSLNLESHGMINAEFLSHQNNDFLLINPARGELIVENDLRDFLKSHPGARAYLDVHVNEPFSPNYWPADQVVATPHIAGVSKNLISSMLDFEVFALKALTQGVAHDLQLLNDRLTPQGFYR
jgi:phosphoglycerate dehydrogenase-like enzyme